MKLNRLFEAKYGKNIDITSKRLTSFPSDLPDEVVGNFFCSDNRLTSLEHCPTKVGGGFYCQFNNLTSLEHCPSEVGGDFSCSVNDLTSLEHCPSVVRGTFGCTANNLTSLEHCPSVVDGHFYCEKNEFTSLKDIHRQIKKIGGRFWFFKNPIKSHILGLMFIEIDEEIRTDLGNGDDVDVILNKWKNQGRKGVLGAQRELLELGYEELARL
jgi:hypothetical protein